jgi:hypothetical protein
MPVLINFAAAAMITAMRAIQIRETITCLKLSSKIESANIGNVIVDPTITTFVDRRLIA